MDDNQDKKSSSKKEALVSSEKSFKLKEGIGLTKDSKALYGGKVILSHKNGEIIGEMVNELSETEKKHF